MPEAFPKDGWSPGLIAQVLRSDVGTNMMDRVSAETIYQALYVQTRGGLRRDLAKNLALKRRQRRPHGHVEKRGTSIYREAFTIRERPAEAADRAVPGPLQSYGRRPRQRLLMYDPQLIGSVEWRRLGPWGGRYNPAMTSTLTPTPTPTPSELPTGLTVEDAVRIAAALEASHAESTRILYAHIWRVWARWCTSRGIDPLPADPAALAAYLVERAADGTAVVTLNLACTAIRHVHLQHGLANPAETTLVRQVRLGLRRTYGTAPTRLARPLTTAEISQILEAIDTTEPIGARDTAIILLGYASAMRGSELAALTPADIAVKPAGLLVTIRHSKTDQEYRGQRVAVAHGTHPATDPVAALAAWTRLRRTQLDDHSDGEPGALFTRTWQTRISDQPLGRWAVARMLRHRAELAGLDGARVTAHSLRAGHATTAALAGVPLHRIAAQTRHRDLGVLLNRYIRPAEALATTSSRDLGL